MRRVLSGLHNDSHKADKRIDWMANEVREVGRSRDNCRWLISTPGVGPMTSTAMSAAIGKGKASDRGLDFAAWLFLVPQQLGTGGRTILGSITKWGSRDLRMLLVRAA